MAVRFEDAMAEAQARERDSTFHVSHSKGSSSGWEYDVAVADSGFHSDIKAAIQLPMKSLNTELQVRLIGQK